MCRFSYAVTAVSCILLTLPSRSSAQDVKPSGDEAITIGGFVSATMYAQNQFFGPGNGQNAIWVQSPQLHEHKGFLGGDVRGTRISITFKGPKISRKWSVGATVEADFFGGFPPPGAYSEEQPIPRLRLAFGEVTNGRTTLRLGQDWAPIFGYVPESVSHVAFPLGWGGGGLIGWRFPGLFFFTDLTPTSRTKVQLQLAAMRNDWNDGPSLPGGISAGQASLAPQLEARLDFSRRPQTGTPWKLFIAGHWDHKSLNGVGIVPTDGLNGWALAGGVTAQPGRWSLLVQSYGGSAIGQQFAQILQFGDFGGWGIQGQLGYNFNDHWSLWGFYGIDDPSRNDDIVPFRGQNQIITPLLQYKVKQFAVGLEWLHAITNHRLSVVIDDENPEITHERVHGDQWALSIRYNF